MLQKSEHLRLQRDHGRILLYYKGAPVERGPEYVLRMQGVAFSDNPLGPFEASKLNPVINSGHETCMFPFRDGVAALVALDGPEKNTIQWSPDGINFEIQSVIKGAPHAIGLNRSAQVDKEPTEILRWGLTHAYKNSDYQYIRGFRTHVVRRHVAKGASGKSE